MRTGEAKVHTTVLVSFPLSTMESPILNALCLTVINFGALQRLIVMENILMGNGEIAKQLVMKVKVSYKINRALG